MGVFETLGVPVIINACGTVTRLSGGIMAPEVAEAMRQASLACVDMAAMQAAACRVIRDVTGAEAGIVTSGASAGVLLGTAACLAGLDPVRMNALPAVADGKCEVVVVRSQRNMYDRALAVAGARIVEVGIPDRVSGPGVRDAAAWEIEAAISPRTALVYYLAGAQSRPRLADVASVAHAHGLPVLVDAAAQLPPACNLSRFLREGADLVCFSGGKAIGGPQSSGVLAGRADLVASALVQMLDLDVFDDLWSVPEEFAGLRQLRGLPHHGIGRSCKVGKEEIAGLCMALRMFADADPKLRRVVWDGRLQAMIAASGVAMTVRSGPIPVAEFALEDEAAAMRVARALAAGAPSVQCGVGRRDEGVLLFNPIAMTDEQAVMVGVRLRECV